MAKAADISEGKTASTGGKPTVILIGADKGGVGKTTVTRTLLDYLESKGIARRAFDTETPKGNLKRFYPDITKVVDVTSAADQMQIFDTISAGEATVIDVRAGLLSATLSALNDIGFLEAVRKGEFNFVLFHILGPSIGSLEEIAATSGYLVGAHHILVRNFINNTTFFEWEPNTYNAYFKKIKGAKEIEIKRLNELACEQVEHAGIPFSSFISNKLPDGRQEPFSFVLRGYVRHWLNSVFAEYDRINFNEFIDQRRKPERASAPAFTAPEPAKPAAAASPRPAPAAAAALTPGAAGP